MLYLVWLTCAHAHHFAFAFYLVVRMPFAHDFLVRFYSLYAMSSVQTCTHTHTKTLKHALHFCVKQGKDDTIINEGRSDLDSWSIAIQCVCVCVVTERAPHIRTVTKFNSGWVCVCKWRRCMKRQERQIRCMAACIVKWKVNHPVSSFAAKRQRGSSALDERTRPPLSPRSLVLRPLTPLPPVFRRRKILPHSVVTYFIRGNRRMDKLLTFFFFVLTSYLSKV